MGFDLSDGSQRASFALRALYEAAGCRKYHMGRFEEYGLYQENRSFSVVGAGHHLHRFGWPVCWRSSPDVTLSIAKNGAAPRARRCGTTTHENVYRPRQRATPSRRSPRWVWRCLGAVGEAEVQQAVCLRWRHSRWKQLGAAVGAGGQPHGLSVRPVGCAGRAETSSPRPAGSKLREKTPTSCAPPQRCRAGSSRGRSLCAL